MRFTWYHSREWRELDKQGWITLIVEGAIALMVRDF